ncbi:MAG TPA: amidohydrolase family protein [Candidatus Dormibacteraeota bacterium]|nr:amidohydrolase family protein [Candidatus Dormibacteraeota bacterium]
MIIDAYAHVFPEPLISAIGAVRSGPELQALKEQSPFLRDPKLRLSYMDQHGFDIQVLVLARPPVWLGMEREDIHRLTVIANDSIAEFAAARPDRFLGVGVLPVVDEFMIAELERIHGQLGLRGVLIFSNIDGQPLDHESMWPLYARAAALDLPIWIHPQHAPSYPWIRKDLMDRMVAWPFDTTVAMIRLVLGGVLDRYPNLKFMTHHMGGMVPYYAKRIEAFADQMVAEYSKLGMADQSPQLSTPVLEQFRRFYNDSVSNGSTAALTCALDFFGAEHILFGTDFPFGPDGGERWPVEELELIQQADISNSDREKILFRNAERLLGVPPTAGSS